MKKLTVKKLTAILPVTQELLDDRYRWQRRCFTHTFWRAGCFDCQADASFEALLFGGLYFRTSVFGLILITRDEAGG